MVSLSSLKKLQASHRMKILINITIGPLEIQELTILIRWWKKSKPSSSRFKGKIETSRKPLNLIPNLTFLNSNAPKKSVLNKKCSAIAVTILTTSSLMPKVATIVPWLFVPNVDLRLESFQKEQPEVTSARFATECSSSELCSRKGMVKLT